MGTVHSIMSKKCAHTGLNHLSGISFKGKIAGIIRDPTMHSRDILRKAKGDHLDQVHSVYSDQMVLVTVRQEAGKIKTGFQLFRDRL